MPAGRWPHVSGSYGFLSTYPPTQCGLANFTAALMRSLTAPGSDTTAGVVRVVIPRHVPLARCRRLQTRAAGGHQDVAELLNSFDVAVIQHDDGIYGGADGDQLLAVRLRMSGYRPSSSPTAFSPTRPRTSDTYSSRS